MRILYWYTRFLTADRAEKRYRGLSSFELNLSTQERFHFDRDRSVFSRETLEPPLPADFWGKKSLYNLHALIGENGSGKTAIIHYIMTVLHNLHNRRYSSSDETLILIENGQEKYLLHLCPDKEPAIPRNIQYVPVRPQSDGGIDGEGESALRLLDRLKLIYHTNTLTLSDSERARADHSSEHRRHHYVYDCSTSALMFGDALDSLPDSQSQTQLLRYFQNEFLTQIEFFSNSKQYNAIQKMKNGCRFRLPGELTIRLLFRDLPEGITVGSFCFTDTLKRALDREADYHKKLMLTLCCACARGFEFNLKNHALPHLRLQRRYRIGSVSLESFQRLFRRILRESLYSTSATHTIDIEEIAALYRRNLELIDFLLREMDSFRQAVKAPDRRKDSSHVEALTFTVSLRDGQNPIPANVTWLQQFFKLYYETSRPYYYLDFSWGLSSGESNLLRLFSSLYHVIEQDKAKISNRRQASKGETVTETDCDSVMILLDEADLTYHPEWQRNYVSTLVALLPSVSADAGVKDIQVVFSTHSPLMLGDMPKNNVTYLPLGNDPIESFGQNIHLILKDSFFLRNGTLGSFASQKIRETTKALLSVQKDGERRKTALERCKLIIQLLAPGPVKSKLTEMYRSAAAKPPLLNLVDNAAPGREELRQLIGELQTRLDKLDKEAAAPVELEGGHDR